MTWVLRLFYTLFVYLRHHLKFQLELIFNHIILLLQAQETPYEHQEIALETIALITKQNHFFIDLFINYDCDLHCSNLLQNIVSFLCKSAHPGGERKMKSKHALALEGVFGISSALYDYAKIETDVELSGEAKREGSYINLMS